MNFFKKSILAFCLLMAAWVTASATAPWCAPAARVGAALRGAQGAVATAAAFEAATGSRRSSLPLGLQGRPWKGLCRRGGISLAPGAGYDAAASLQVDVRQWVARLSGVAARNTTAAASALGKATQSLHAAPPPVSSGARLLAAAGPLRLFQGA